MGKRQKGSSKRSLLILLSVLSFVICAIVVGIVVVINNNKFIINTPEEASTYLADYMEADNPDGFIEAGDRALAVATNDDVKAYIYLMRSSMLFNYNINSDNQYLEQMLSDAYSAENLSPTAQSAYRISVCEEVSGNKEKAEEYLNIAKDRGLLDSQGRG